MFAVDGVGTVHCFAHGSGDWAAARSLAFGSLERLLEHVAFQEQFEPPPHDADLAALQARKAAIEQFMKGRRDAPYSRCVADEALADLREAIAERRFAASKKGSTLAATQALGQRCEQALREAGAPGDWLCRAAGPDGRALAVMGNFKEPWTTERVAELLRPIVGAHPVRWLPRAKV